MIESSHQYNNNHTPLPSTDNLQVGGHVRQLDEQQEGYQFVAKKCEFREINLNKPNFKLSNLQNVSFFSEKTITSSDQLRPIAETIVPSSKSPPRMKLPLEQSTPLIAPGSTCGYHVREVSITRLNVGWSWPRGVLFHFEPLWGRF